MLARRVASPARCSLKAVKLIAIGFVIVVVAGVTAYLLRDRIIRRLTGPFLLEYGMTLTDVSLDALSTRNASIRYIELEHDNGTIFRVSDLSLSLSMDPAAAKSFSAGNVTIIVPDGDSAQSTSMADVVRQILSLPESLPNAELLVSKLDIPPYPGIENLEWRSTDQDQSLSVSLASIDVHAAITRKDASGHAAALTIGEKFLVLDIAEQESGISLDGSILLDLPSMVELLKPIVSLPQQLAVVAGSAELRYGVLLPSDPDDPARAILDVTPATAIELDYSPDSAAATHLQIASASPLSVELRFPAMEWTIEQARASLLVSFGKWQNLPIMVSNVVCRSDLTCTTDVQINAEKRDLGLATADTLHYVASQQLSLRDDEVLVEFGPQATLTMTGVASPDFSAKRVTTTLESGASIELTSRGWQLGTESVEARIDSFSIANDAEVDMLLILGNLNAGETDQVMVADLQIRSAAPTLRWGKRGIAVPELTGSVSMQGNDIVARLSPAGRTEGGKPLVHISHNFKSETGRLLVQNAALDFARQSLAERILPWPYELNIMDGSVLASLQVDWEKPRAEFRFNGQSRVELSSLAGLYGDIVFAGLSTAIKTHFDSRTGIRIEPASVTMALLEIGLPIDNISADMTPEVQNRSVQVDNLRMSAFGGVIRADPFSYDSAADSNTLILRADSIELAELLTLKEFEKIELSGSIAAELPVTIEGESIMISGGKLTGEAPGGVIRYLPGLAVDETSASSIGLVTRALSNFEYEALDADVDYGKDGDLKLQMKLTGRNPDLESGRPVVLNLGVENNVPKMLKSLQAARTVEEILLRRLTK